MPSPALRLMLVLAGLPIAAMAAVVALNAAAAPPARQAGGATLEQVQLGSRLFFDPRLSADGKVSCSTCHQPEKDFTDGRHVAQGIEGKVGVRNSPTLLNVGHHRAFFWDGRAPSLEQQVLEPLTNPVEHGLSGNEQVLALLRSDAGYSAQFSRAFPKAGNDPIRADTVAASLAAFVRSLVSREGAIDRYVLKGDKAALSAEARAGFEIFRGKAQCSSCHVLGDDAGTGRVQLSDQQFHAHGQHTYPMQEFVRGQLSMGMTKSDIGKLNPTDVSALGRFMVTGIVEDAGGFKTPTLRNVARTAPYFHDGSVATLEGALNRELLGKSADVALSEVERRQMLAFLGALNDDSLPPSVPRASR